jgi:hypothetical protein
MRAYLRSLDGNLDLLSFSNSLAGSVAGSALERLIRYLILGAVMVRVVTHPTRDK